MPSGSPRDNPQKQSPTDKSTRSMDLPSPHTPSAAVPGCAGHLSPVTISSPVDHGRNQRVSGFVPKKLLHDDGTQASCQGDTPDPSTPPSDPSNTPCAKLAHKSPPLPAGCPGEESHMMQGARGDAPKALESPAAKRRARMSWWSPQSHRRSTLLESRQVHGTALWLARSRGKESSEQPTRSNTPVPQTGDQVSEIHESTSPLSSPRSSSAKQQQLLSDSNDDPARYQKRHSSALLNWENEIRQHSFGSFQGAVSTSQDAETRDRPQTPATPYEEFFNRNDADSRNNMPDHHRAASEAEGNPSPGLSPRNPESPMEAQVRFTATPTFYPPPSPSPNRAPSPPHTAHQNSPEPRPFISSPISYESQSPVRHSYEPLIGYPSPPDRPEAPRNYVYGPTSNLKSHFSSDLEGYSRSSHGSGRTGCHRFRHHSFGFMKYLKRVFTCSLSSSVSDTSSSESSVVEEKGMYCDAYDGGDFLQVNEMREMPVRRRDLFGVLMWRLVLPKQYRPLQLDAWGRLLKSGLESEKHEEYAYPPSIEYVNYNLASTPVCSRWKPGDSIDFRRPRFAEEYEGPVKSKLRGPERVWSPYEDEAAYQEYGYRRFRPDSDSTMPPFNIDNFLDQHNQHGSPFPPHPHPHSSPTNPQAHQTHAHAHAHPSPPPHRAASTLTTPRPSKTPSKSTTTTTSITSSTLPLLTNSTTSKSASPASTRYSPSTPSPSHKIGSSSPRYRVPLSRKEARALGILPWESVSTESYGSSLERERNHVRDRDGDWRVGCGDGDGKCVPTEVVSAGYAARERREREKAKRSQRTAGTSLSGKGTAAREGVKSPRGFRNGSWAAVHHPHLHPPLTHKRSLTASIYDAAAQPTSAPVPSPPPPPPSIVSASDASVYEYVDDANDDFGFQGCWGYMPLQGKRGEDFLGRMGSLESLSLDVRGLDGE
ncbi:hypothetical protein K402DRAFT_406206 [Aulographum hederae CBS 113979]|uniref:Uncharacterized protein n=1 Tax=Aulographum hederae CBS 113979 TaxID=1176131 RepID=A0A6G1GTX5_9PEZI|nr:hypothetical protein K402DRAFT_406206 [Aulographum hederae CBS 113979]